MPTQTKRRPLPKQVYSLERVELEKPHLNKTKWPKSPITDQKTSDKIVNVREKNRNYVQKYIKEKCVKVKRRKHDLPANLQEICQSKPSGMQLIGSENTTKKYSGIHGKFVKQKNHTEMSNKNNDHKPDLELRLSTKIWQLMNRDIFPNLNDEKFAGKIHVTDSEMKKYIISVIKKYNKKDIKRRFNSPQNTQTRKGNIKSTPFNAKRDESSDKKTAIKRKVRRQIWQWTKTAIKNNEHWSQILADNHVAIDNINIDQMDLSVIDVDALGIENKILKRTIVWLLK